MSLRVGRVLRDGTQMAPVVRLATGVGRRGRVKSKEEVDLAVAAREAVVRARKDAEAILQAAQAERDRILDEARREGLAEGTARLASAWIALRARQAGAAREIEEQAIDIARLLAERLLGEALRVDPTVVVALAREVMRPLVRARRVTIEAHPEDVPVLQANLGALPVDPSVVEVVASSDKARGCVKVGSDLGTLDGDLAPQLDRLAEALRRELPVP